MKMNTTQAAEVFSRLTAELGNYSDECMKYDSKYIKTIRINRDSMLGKERTLRQIKLGIFPKTKKSKLKHWWKLNKYFLRASGWL
jgi:hypothetical protein